MPRTRAERLRGSPDPFAFGKGGFLGAGKPGGFDAPRPRGDRVGKDSGFSALFGERLGEAFDPEFGSAVGALPRKAHDGRPRAGQQDGAAASRPEFGHEFPNEQERGSKVYGHHLVPVRVRRLLDRPHVKHRGAVHERGEVSPRDLSRACRRLERAFPVGEVADQRVGGTRPPVCRGLHCGLELIPRAVEQDALGSFRGESPRCRGAESTRGSGDEDPMPQELFAHQPGSTPRRR